MKFCGNLDQYLTRTIHTKVKFHESHFFSLLLFFFFYFPILFFSAKLTLTENSSSPLFWPFPLFQKWFHTMSSVFIVATSQKTNDPCELNIWESNDADQNNEKRVQLVMSTETELLFFLRLNASKRLDIAQNPSRKV